MALQHDTRSFYGKSLRTAHVGGFRIQETGYLDSVKTPAHRHSRAYFAFTIQGASVQKYAKGSLQCDRGTLVFHPPEEIHSDDFIGPEVRVLQVEVDSSRIGILDGVLELVPPSTDLAGPAVSSLTSRLYREFLRMDELSYLAIEGLVLELLAAVSRKTICPGARKVPVWLARSEELIKLRFTESLRFNIIAEEIGVHPVHLAREFRRQYGCTMGEKVRQLRVEYACREIVHSGRRLSEIALNAGFADQSHFTRTFRGQTGMTPSQFSRAFHRANSIPIR